MTAAENATTDSQSPPPPCAKRQRRNFVWLLVHVVVYLPFRLWCRTHVIGRDNIDETQGGVLLVNHQSFLDPLFVAVRLTRPVAFLARDSLFRVPFIGWICRHTYVIPISRTAFRGGSIRAALDRLNQNFLVGLYPEGTRSAGPPKAFRPGFLSLIRRTDLPIYPVAIVGAERIMPKGAWFIRPGKVTVVYGAPLSAEDRDALNSSSDDRAMAELMRQRVLELYQTVAGKLESPDSEPAA